MDVPGATLEPWDWQYYAEQVRRADYALNESEVRQYFELDRVLRDGDAAVRNHVPRAT